MSKRDEAIIAAAVEAATRSVAQRDGALNGLTIAELDAELARTIAHESAVIARMTELRRQDPKL